VQLSAQYLCKYWDASFPPKEGGAGGVWGGMKAGGSVKPQIEGEGLMGSVREKKGRQGDTVWVTAHAKNRDRANGRGAKKKQGGSSKYKEEGESLGKKIKFDVQEMGALRAPCSGFLGSYCREGVQAEKKWDFKYHRKNELKIAMTQRSCSTKQGGRRKRGVKAEGKKSWGREGSDREGSEGFYGSVHT